MKKLILAVIVLVIVGSTGYWFYGQRDRDKVRTAKVQDYYTRINALQAEFKAYGEAERLACDPNTTIQQLHLNEVGLIVCVTKAEAAAAQAPKK